MPNIYQDLSQIRTKLKVPFEIALINNATIWDFLIGFILLGQINVHSCSVQNLFTKFNCWRIRTMIIKKTVLYILKVG